MRSVDVPSVPSRERLRVLIAEHDPVFRRQLRDLASAEPDFDVVGEADEGLLALQLARWLRPDVVLLDGEMPGLSGTDVASLLALQMPDTSVVVLHERGTTRTDVRGETLAKTYR